LQEPQDPAFSIIRPHAARSHRRARRGLPRPVSRAEICPAATWRARAGGKAEIAAWHDRILQVGHFERFNAAILALGDTPGKPRRLFPDDAYVSIDLQQKVLTIVRKPPPGIDAAPGQVVIEERSYERGDSLETAIRITELIQA
jgi:hypothetical protein